MSTFIFKDLKCDLTTKDVASMYFSSMEITSFGASFTEYCNLVIGVHLYCTLQLGYHKQPYPAEDLGKLVCEEHPTNTAIMFLIICNILWCVMQCFCSLTLQRTAFRLLPYLRSYAILII